MEKYKSIIVFSTIFALFTACSSNTITTSIQDNVSISSSSSDTDDFLAKYISTLKRDSDSLKDTPPQAIEGSKVDFLKKFSDNKKLTYLTYEALDNNLYGDLNRVVDILEYIGSSNEINLIAQTDNWGADNAARYYIKKDTKTKIISDFVKLSPEADSSGVSKNLTDAIKWGFSTYPSKIKWFNMSSHGMGFYGIGYDDNPESNMNIIEFASSLKSGLNGKKLDLVSFDACLMSTVEVASEMKDVSNYMVASEDSTFYWGYGYYKTLSKISENTNITSNEIARSLVLDVNNKGSGRQTFTIASTDLTKFDSAEKAINDLSIALRKALPKHHDDILRALEKTKAFAQAEDTPFRDVNRLVSSLKSNVKDLDIVNACDKINDVFYKKGVVMLSRQSKDEKDQGRGLSIYLPTGGKVSQLYRKTRFAQNTQWDEFLLDINATIKPKT